MNFEKRSTKQILRDNLSRKSPPGMQQLVLILHNVRSMYNVGATFRNADAFGIKKIVLSGITPTPPRPEISKTAIGAEQYVDWEHPSNLNEFITGLKDDGYICLGIEQTANSELLTEYQPEMEKKVCLVFGNEVTGLDEEVLPMLDHFLEIPQYGHKHSLNVSVTVGVVLYAFLQKYWR